MMQFVRFPAGLAASAARRRIMSHKPKPSAPPIPIWRKSRRARPAQLRWRGDMIVGSTSMVEHEFGGVQQCPKNVLRGCAACRALPIEHRGRSLQFGGCRRTAVAREIEFGHNLVRREFAVRKFGN